MNTHKFMVDTIRFHASRPDILVFVGWFYDGTARNHTLSVWLDDIELSVERTVYQGAEIYQKYRNCVNEISEQVVGAVHLPQQWEQAKKLRILSSYAGKMHTDAVYSVKKVKRLQSQPEYFIGDVRVTDHKINVSGWCMGEGSWQFKLMDGNGNELQGKTEYFSKKDAECVGLKDEIREKTFFSMQADGICGKKFYLEICGSKGCGRVKLYPSKKHTYVLKIWRLIKKSIRFLRQNGMQATMVRIAGRLTQGRNRAYVRWRKKHRLTEKMLKEQKMEQRQWQNRPKFSILVPLYCTQERFLRELIASVQSQTYDNWELCFADGSGDGGERLSALVREYQKDDPRIRYRILEKNEGISQNTNAAMQMAEGDFLVLVDHDDTISPEALFSFAKAVQANAQIDALYSDEDKTDASGTQYMEPQFKPDYNLDLLLCNNYICHLFAVRREIALEVGGLRSEYDGSQDYDFILRCCERAKAVYHVPKILYHWRCHIESTAVNQQSKLYVYEAGRRAVQAHFDRLQIPAKAEHAQFFGLYRTHYHWPQKPLVSVVIIVNQSQTESVRQCVESVILSNYSHYEIILVAHKSEEQNIEAYCRKLSSEYVPIKPVSAEEHQKPAQLYNIGCRSAQGEYVLLLDAQTELADPCVIEEMLGYCMRNDVGAVGTKIICPDNTIYHAGIVLDQERIAGYIYQGKSRYAVDYASRSICAQNYSAVSDVCMMVKRSVYERVGGMTEDFLEILEDVDLCLKIRSAGFLVVYTPNAEVFYFGPKRGRGPVSGKNDRCCQQDRTFFKKQWKKLLEQADPYYNPNLKIERADFTF